MNTITPARTRRPRYNRSMRYLYIALVISLSAPFFLRAADVVLMEEIAAKVNGDIVTSTELRDERKALEAELSKSGLSGAEYEAALKQATSELLSNKIDQILLRQKGKDMNLKVETDLNKQIADFQRNLGKPDPEEFQKFVVEQTGRSYEDFKTGLQDKLLVDGVVREEVYRKIQIPAEEIRAYYNEHQSEMQRKERVFLRELFVQNKSKSADDVAAAETKAKGLGVRAKNGEAFLPMVQNNSDAVSKEQGGILDPATRGMLAPDLEAKVWDQPAGFVTDPIKMPEGWLILKVEDHQREGQAKLEEVESEIQNALYSQRAGPAARAYLQKLRLNAFLQIKEGYVDAGAAPGKDTRWGDVATLKPETITREEVIANPSMKRLLGLFPVPGTEKTGASSSR
ncbi:MAG: peptidyl-prolyl cis-trans isomerase [Acidobacteriota bacterium]